MAEANTTETTRKPAARKAAAPKAAARKPAARKPAARKAAPRAASRKAAARKPDATLRKVQDTVKEVAYVQLGLAGRVYDEVNTRMNRARKDAPKQWDQLVRRGEQVQRDLDKAGKGLKRDLKQRVDRIETRVKLEGRIRKVRAAVDKLTKRVRKAA